MNPSLREWKTEEPGYRNRRTEEPGIETKGQRNRDTETGGQRKEAKNLRIEGIENREHKEIVNTGES